MLHKHTSAAPYLRPVIGRVLELLGPKVLQLRAHQLQQRRHRLHAGQIGRRRQHRLAELVDQHDQRRHDPLEEIAQRVAVLVERGGQRLRRQIWSEIADTLITNRWLRHCFHKFLETPYKC